MGQTHWVSALSLLQPTSDQVMAWLSKPYILSKALKRVTQSLQVKVLDQHFSQALDDEYAVLNLAKTQLPFVRQVFLIDESERPLTYGRVIIPKATYEAHFKDFDKLGSNLLGETLLYRNPDVTRSQFEFACLNENDPRCAFVYEHIHQEIARQPLWARRSIFYIKSLPLLVSELFLPFLPAYIPGDDDAP